MRIGFFSDLHLGKRQYGLEEREEDFYDQYDLAMKTFIENDVDLIISAGDIFDMPRPSPKTFGRFLNGLKYVNENNIDFVNVIGNHSIVQSGNFLTSDELVNDIELEHYYLLNEEVFYNNENVVVAGLPYHFNYEFDGFKEKVSNLNNQVKQKEGFKILILHQAFKEYCGFSGEELSINDLDLSGFDLIVCGHIHNRVLTNIDDNTIYLQPGSIERCTVAEARDEENEGKGVYIIDTDSDIDAYSISNGFIPLRNNRKFIILNTYIDKDEDIDGMEREIYSYVKNLSVQPILFLDVHDVTNSFTRILDLTKEMKSDCLTVNFNYFDENFHQNEIDLGSNIPTIEETLKIALNPLDDDERALGLDLYRLLKDGKDVSGILSDFFEKKMGEEEVRVDFYNDDELEEIINAFEK